MFLFSTDIDGTIYDGPDSANLFSTYWSELLSSEPAPVLVYNTGRSVTDARELVASTTLPTPDYIIGGVGTEIYELATEKVVPAWSAELASGWDVDQVIKTVRETVSDIEPQPDSSQNPFKSSWFWFDKEREDIDQLADSLTQAGLIAQIVYSSSRDLDIIPVAANKGNAIQWLARYLGIDHRPLAVAGDSGNDSSMFLLDDVFGIVVANAEDRLPATIAGVEFHHSSLPCAEGVIDGLGVLVNQLSEEPSPNH